MHECFTFSEHIIEKIEELHKEIEDKKLEQSNDKSQIPEKEVKNEFNIKKVPKEEIPILLKNLANEMKLAAANLEFEKAAAIRDEIERIKKER